MGFKTKNGNQVDNLVQWGATTQNIPYQNMQNDSNQWGQVAQNNQIQWEDNTQYLHQEYTQNQDSPRLPYNQGGKNPNYIPKGIYKQFKNDDEYDNYIYHNLPLNYYITPSGYVVKNGYQEIGNGKVKGKGLFNIWVSGVPSLVAKKEKAKKTYLLISKIIIILLIILIILKLVL